MKLPYNVLHVSGNILFAARGGKIHSFNLEDGAHLSTWKHPDVEKVDAALKSNEAAASNENVGGVELETPEVGGSGEPPAKRQRVEDSKTKAEDTNTAEKSEKQDEGKGSKGGKKSKNRQHNQNKQLKREPQMNVPDRPVVTHLTTAPDGTHLLAITGHDKMIWVFKHDSKGKLDQLSSRTMPKRPSSVTIGSDSQIICADKFGDVYALPLIESESLDIAQPSAPSLAVSKQPFKPSANTTTVHSKRNLRALANQQQQIELTTRSKPGSAPKSEGPDFDLTLLLGHVSMLTSILLGENEGRKYILSADRDEHIRVSRYLPQAYVIECFCFGHKEFVGAMTIPQTKRNVLVTGGGDEDLFIWDWKNGKLLSKANLLSLAREVAPEVSKVAVSTLETVVYPTEAGHLEYVVAICEDIGAIFSWQLTSEDTLNHPSVIQLPGKPLDVAFKPSHASEPPKLITAIDSGEQAQVRSLATYSLAIRDEKLAVGETTFLGDEDLEAEELDVTEKVVRGLLYNTENLRKQTAEAGEEPNEEQGGEEQILEVEATED